jgi:superfamily II DNA/RNA helicase
LSKESIFLGNIIAQSQSGTGKTAAFSLAIISRIDPSIQSPQALILAPTFELAKQIILVIETMAQFLPYIKVADAVRESKTNITRGKLLTDPIVVGTPGTVEEWCFKQRVIDLSKLRMFCVDDADVMIATQSIQLTYFNLVLSLNHSNCQVMLFSTTFSDEAMVFAKLIVQNPVVLRLKREKQMLPNIRQFFINCCDPEQKYHAIEQIFASLTLGQAIIFCQTKSTASDLNIRMANQGHSVRELTETLDIEQRANIINTFREGIFRVLISQNVTLRGKLNYFHLLYASFSFQVLILMISH